LGILLRHLGLDLRPVAQWTAEMMETMLSEFPALIMDGTVPLSTEVQASRDEAEMMICVLLRSITKVIKVSSLDPSNSSRPLYPELILLDNAWTSKILRSAAYVKSAVSSEAIQYIQAFLDERLRALSSNTSLSATSRRDDESQDYGDAEYDYDDPAFLQLLEATEGIAVPPTMLPPPAEKELAHLLDKDLSPAVFQLISNFFADETVLPIDQWSMVDAAVDCWAGCGQLLVSNNLRDWSSYVSMYGAESYTRLTNKAERRRVGLRLMYKAILLDPAAYKRCEEEFLSMWCQTIVRPKLTFEHLYTQALLGCDPARHGLLEPLYSGEYRQNIETADAAGLEACRLGLIDAVLVHAGEILASTSEEPSNSKQRRITAVVIKAVAPAMRDCYWIYMSTGALESKRRYHQFCQTVLGSLKRHVPQLVLNSDLNWLPSPQPDIHTVQNAIIH